MLRRSVIDSVGPFNEELTADVDVDMWLRVAQAHSISAVPQVLLDYRVHRAAMSANRDLMERSVTYVRNAALQSGLVDLALDRDPRSDAADVFARMSLSFALRGYPELAASLLTRSIARGTVVRQTLARGAIALARRRSLHRAGLRAYALGKRQVGRLIHRSA
jgi:hypothetical protein